MKPRILAGLLILACPAFAQVDDAALRRLVEDSPFQPLRSGAPIAATAHPVEFRGYAGEGEQRIFSVYDAERKLALWLRLRETVEGVSVRAFDSRSELVTIERRGLVYELPLSLGRTDALLLAAGDTTKPPSAAVATGEGPPLLASAHEQLAEAQRLEAYAKRRQEVLDRLARRRQLLAGGKGNAIPRDRDSTPADPGASTP